MALPRVNTKVFLFLFFFPPFFGGLPKVDTRVFLFLFFFHPFPAGSLCMAKPAFVYFKWRCAGLIPGFFFLFFRLFFGGLPKVSNRVLLLLLLFSPLTNGPTQAIAFLKIKNMANLVKKCRDAS